MSENLDTSATGVWVHDNDSHDDLHVQLSDDEYVRINNQSECPIVVQINMLVEALVKLGLLAKRGRRNEQCRRLGLT